MNRSTFLKTLAVAGLSLAAIGVHAQNCTIGASLPTQQHPFFLELADAMKKQAAKGGVKLDPSIADQDLNKQIPDVEDLTQRLTRPEAGLSFKEI